VKGRAGFTLIEVIVALTIAGLVIVAAHEVFRGVADGTKALASARESLDRTANARRWLKATFLSLDPPFEGRTTRMSFTSWQPTPRGWFAPQPIVLSLDGDRFTAVAGDEALDLGSGVRSVAFDYLLEPGAESKWVREWVSPVSAPLALRLRIAGCGRGDARCVDTLLFPIKERG
jgi:prepilin-type N-terminal cleavage/methylation domain-containing protein